MLKVSIHLLQSMTFVILFSALNGCARQEELNANKYRETQMLMGTIIHIDVCQDAQNTQEGVAAYKADNNYGKSDTIPSHYR